MPTPEAVAGYVQKLPAIYRDILKAYPQIEPTRKAGYGLAFQTLAAHFTNTRKKFGMRGYGVAEVEEACRRMAEMGFLEIRNEFFAHPSILGEQLIAAASGVDPAPPMTVPELPRPTW